MIPIALIMMAAGAVQSAAGAFKTAKGQRTAYQAQAGMAEVNARLAELSAKSVLRAGQLEEQKAMLDTAQAKSSQRASYAASGVALDSGSVARVSASTQFIGNINAATIKANAARSAWGYRTQSVNYQNEADMARTAGSMIDPMLEARKSLISSATSVASAYQGYKSVGLAGQ